MNTNQHMTLAISNMNIQFDPATKPPKLTFSKENEPLLFLQTIKADKKYVKCSKNAVS